MPRGRPKKDGRGKSPGNRKNWFKPGNKGFEGTPLSMAQELKKALQDDKAKNGEGLIRHAFRRARHSDTVLANLMGKLLPNKSEISFTASDLEDVKTKILTSLTRHCKDPAILRAVANDLNRDLAEHEAALQADS